MFWKTCCLHFFLIDHESPIFALFFIIADVYSETDYNYIILKKQIITVGPQIMAANSLHIWNIPSPIYNKLYFPIVEQDTCIGCLKCKLSVVWKSQEKFKERNIGRKWTHGRWQLWSAEVKADAPCTSWSPCKDYHDRLSNWVWKIFRLSFLLLELQN